MEQDNIEHEPMVNTYKRAKRDLVYLVLFSIPTYALILYIDLFDWLYHWSRAHENWEVDEIIVLFLVMGVGFLFYSYRRWMDLRTEINRRHKAEIKLARSERMAAIGTLSSGISHQFHNINAVILSMSELIMLENEDKLGKDVTDILKMIKERALYGSEIAKNLSRFADPEINDISLEYLPLIIQSTMKSLQPIFEKENIELEMKLDTVSKVKVNSLEISQAIYNLVINAQHALLGLENKKIVIACHEEKGKVIFSVSDNGCGMSKEDIAKAFSPFFSTKGEHAIGMTPQAKVRGVGLGLSVTLSIVQELGGDISVTSEPGKGSTFTFWLPVASETEV